MAIDSILSSLEAGIAEGRKDALARQQLEQQQQQAAQSQANNDRTYQLSVLNSMIGLQQSMPKPETEAVKAARLELQSLDPGVAMAVMSGQIDNPVVEHKIRMNAALLGDEGKPWTAQLDARAGSADALARRRFNTSMLNLSEESRATFESDLVSALANNDIETFAKTRNLTNAQAVTMAADFSAANGDASIQFVRDARTRQFVQGDTFKNAIDKMDRAVSSASKKSVEDSVEKELEDLNAGLKVFQSDFNFATSEYGGGLITSYTQKIARIQEGRREVYRVQPERPLNVYEQTAIEKGDAETWYAGQTDDMGSKLLRRIDSSFPDMDVLPNERSGKIRGMLKSYKEGTLAPDDAVKYGSAIVDALVTLGRIDPGDAMDASTSLRSGNVRGPQTAAEMSRAQTVLKDVREDVLKSSGGTDQATMAKHSAARLAEILASRGVNKYSSPAVFAGEVKSFILEPTTSERKAFKNLGPNGAPPQSIIEAAEETGDRSTIVLANAAAWSGGNPKERDKTWVYMTETLGYTEAEATAALDKLFGKREVK